MVLTAVVIFFLVLFVADERAPLVFGVHVLISVRVRVLPLGLLVLAIFLSSGVLIDDGRLCILTEGVLDRSAARQYILVLVDLKGV